uniref:Uncharacterized protein n=1 Tax=Anopheles atroparvus TaxID=41427 RepID=A0AAG5CQS2_ANOAO
MILRARLPLPSNSLAMPDDESKRRRRVSNKLGTERTKIVEEYTGGKETDTLGVHGYSPDRRAPSERRFTSKDDDCNDNATTK